MLNLSSDAVGTELRVDGGTIEKELTVAEVREEGEPVAI
jgi:hypothetical protein